MLEKTGQFLKHLYSRMMDADVFGLAAQLAYFFLLSLFPFLLFLVTLVGYFPIDEDYLISFLDAYAPAEIINLIESNLTRIVNVQNGSLLSLGIIGTLWSASNGVNAITKAMNKAYDVEEDRSFILARLISILLTVAMVVVISVALLLPVFGQVIGSYLFSFIGLSETFINLWITSRWIVSSAVFLIVFITLYTLAPNMKVKIRHTVWGALFATISWQLVSLGFSYYVSSIGNYSATYGSLGTIIVLMIWFFISGIIIITGGVINATVKKMSLNK